MIPWEQRPPEIANLFNPAFCGEILLRCIKKYNQTAKRSFPYPLIFLILPIILHKKTRDSILQKTRTQLHVWLQSNQDVRIGFTQRAKEMVPFTRESIVFLFHHGQLIIEPSGLLTNHYKPKRITSEYTEADDCFIKSEIIGRKFARAGNPTTIFTMWGVRP